MLKQLDQVASGYSGISDSRGDLRWRVHPDSDAHVSIDVTDAVIAAVASEIGAAVGGNETLNRLEAERHVQELLVRGRPLRESGEPPSNRPSHARSFADAILATHASRRLGTITIRPLDADFAPAETAPAWLRRAPHAPFDRSCRLAGRLGLIRAPTRRRPAKVESL